MHLYINVGCNKIGWAVFEHKIVKSRRFSSLKRIEQNGGHIAAADKMAAIVTSEPPPIVPMI